MTYMAESTVTSGEQDTRDAAKILNAHQKGY